MMHDLIEKTLKLNMTMVPVVVETPQIKQSTRQHREISRFNFIRLLQNAGTLALILMLSAVSYLTINHYFLGTVEVVGVSMVPTLQEHGHYVLNRWAFHKRAPQ